jgi:hypothetical protein
MASASDLENAPLQSSLHQLPNNEWRTPISVVRGPEGKKQEK